MNSFRRAAVAWVFGVAALALAAPQAGTGTVVRADAVLVDKSERELRLLRDGAVIATFAVALGFNPQGDKNQQGDGRTPEGDYVLDWRNPQSRFHLSIHISYPNAADRAEAAARGASPGGDIFIHGTPGLASVAGWDWALGCIAVSNADMDAIWAMVPDGTPITIRP
jgi:murein L,D-transpeptidase YafK